MSGHHDDRAAGVPGQPARYRAADAPPAPGRSADDQRVRVLLGGDGGQLAGRAAPPGAHVHVEAGRGRRSVPARPAATSPGRRRARAGRSPGRSAVRSTCRWTTRARSAGGGPAGAPPRPRRPARCGCTRSRRNPPRPDDRAGHGRAVPAHAAVPAGPEGDKTLPGPMSASLREPVSHVRWPRVEPLLMTPGGAPGAGLPGSPVAGPRRTRSPGPKGPCYCNVCPFNGPVIPSFIWYWASKYFSRAPWVSVAGLNRTPEERSVMRAIKTALDPSSLFNPGVLFS